MLNLFFKDSQLNASGPILSVETMKFVLERECARAERTQSPFALIVATFELGLRDSKGLSQVGNVLANRLRLTDEAGMLEDGRLAILLSGTGEGGAWKFARDLCAKLQESRQPACEIFVYPAEPTDLGGSPRDTNTRKDRGRLDRPTPDASQFYVKPLPRWKRTIDLLLGSLTLFLATPFLLLAAVAIKATSDGPVFFRQQRSGLGGRPFTIFKLRTMTLGAEREQRALSSENEQDGPAFKMRNDPRVTTVGKFLRKSCIDELPQLINVLRGEMSIVGPRPLPLKEADSCQDWEKRRMDVTPGLTCSWQVRGGLNVSFSEWMRMDIRYIRARTILTDSKLMVQTALAVFLHRASC